MTKLKIVAISASCFVVGLIIGALAGSWITSNIMGRMMDPVMVSTGDQAHKTLVLLETDRSDELTLYLEAEITRSLEYLERLEKQERIPSGSPMLLVQERLREFKASHQFETPNPFLGTGE